jgi:two-component system, chemotaxis family, protein-glutamate methylesterase/glutaminase
VSTPDAPSPVRVLVVDDSPTMRLLIARSLREGGGIEVVGEAENAADAREAMKRLDPDVVTLDVEMPGMQGIEFLEKVMRLRPTPVVMVSNQTGPGTTAAIQALEIGAFDCVVKPRHAGDEAFARLAETVRLAARARDVLVALANRRFGKPRPAPAPTRKAPLRARPDLITIGASTGGIEALTALLRGWPEDAPPTLVVQHLPAGFSRGFAQRLAKSCAVRVAEAEDGMPLRSGEILIAPGGARHLLAQGGAKPACSLVAADPVSGHRPSVDVLFHSAARAFGARALGLILTGMGSDGARGALESRKAGGWIIGQDEASSLVYGMPKAAFQIGAVDHQMPLDLMAEAVFGTHASPREPASCL